ncbi:hydrolase 2, exosortase A system-associated [Pseudothauera nasutitermitis]|uniref:Hydrolase 2, exosortase A system-associated n=1 Tax=Pseudothauera nasutitermitis TaxID=2565930 RepID=A0A4S4AXN7_9RHOO|nr:hydrolase 2, exosortase A system-associated [Pseudothauera nasutitermitis]
MAREAFFLDSPRGRRFCIASRPPGQALGTILYAPPFAEEMNKSRRMAALAARAFAARGWLVLQPDLMGCGDSEGELAEARWQDWLDDLQLAWDWLCARAGGIRVVWSLRAGSLLAADWLRASAEAPALLLWQPVSGGRQHLTQFLRLRGAADMLAEADAQASMKAVRAGLERGECVEIAGYTLSPLLARGMETSAFELPAGYISPVVLLEMGAEGRTELSPALLALRGRLEAAGVAVQGHVVPGAAFWQTQEIEAPPALVDHSLDALNGLRA